MVNSSLLDGRLTKRGNSRLVEARLIALAITMTGKGTIQISVDVCTFLSFRVSASLTSHFPITAEMFAKSSGHTISDGGFTATGNASGFANTGDYLINGGTFVAASSTSQAPTYHQAYVNYGTSQGNAPSRPYQGQQGKSEQLCSNSCQAHVIIFRLWFQIFLPP